MASHIDDERTSGALTPRDRVFYTPELRDMVFRMICCPRSFCTVRAVSKQFAIVYECAMSSLYSPVFLAKVFFSDPLHAMSVVRDARAIMAGSAVRQYLYDLNVGDGSLTVLVNENAVDDVLDLITSDGYSSLLPPGTTPVVARGRACRRPTMSFPFARDDLGDTRRICVRVVIHDPLRVLFSAYGMHGCDGRRFFDLYPRLGRLPIPVTRVRGRYPQLLSPRECKAHMPLEAFSNDGDDLATTRTVFLERWLGDSNTWVVPSARDYTTGPELEKQGWTVRLHVKRIDGTPHIHFWTDATCRCLRHELLRHSYVTPTPSMEYGKRVLDRFLNVLASGVGTPILGPTKAIVTDFDAELATVVECLKEGRDYRFHVTGYNFSVDRSYCSYEDLLTL